MRLRLVERVEEVGEIAVAAAVPVVLDAVPDQPAATLRFRRSRLIDERDVRRRNLVLDYHGLGRCEQCCGCLPSNRGPGPA